MFIHRTQHPVFKWVNTVLGNVESAIRGTFPAVSEKHAPGYMAQFEYRFNRRFHLPDMIERLLQALQVDFVAETLSMGSRSLQRALARQGLTYSQILTETRIRQAAHWLENTDKPIAEIAFDLCYTDASNFSRAFRRHIGVPPLAFRCKARGL